jgi:hypothetical protein
MGSHAHAAASGDFGKAAAFGVGSVAVASGRGGLAFCMEAGGRGAAGPDGVLALCYWDGSRMRVKVGYVGEDIEEGVIYGCENGAFVRAEEMVTA